MGNVVNYGSVEEDGTGDEMHVAFAKIDAGSRLFGVIDKDLTAPPGIPAIGDCYVVGASATGAWATHDGKVAVYGLGDTWLFIAPAEGMFAYMRDEDKLYRYTGSAWSEFTPGVVGSPFEMEIAISDETTALTTGTSKITFYAAMDATITEVFIGLSTQSSSGVVTADLNKNGSTMFSTNPSIDANEDTSLTGTAAVLSTTTWAKGNKMTADIDAAGTGAKGLKMIIRGTRL